MSAAQNTDKVVKIFLKYIELLGVSKKTEKNYRSDISNFTLWMMNRVKTWGVAAKNLAETVPFIDKQTGFNYKKHLRNRTNSIKTVNRRLSTLRHFGRFLASEQILNFDFMKKVTNVSTKKSPSKNLISNFEAHLKTEKVSKNTIKGYLSDTRQFLLWLEQQQLT